MKTFLLTGFLVLSFLSPTLVLAKATKKNETIQVTAALSTLLLREDYMRLLAQVQKQAEQNRQHLQITRIEQYGLGGQNFIEVSLEQKSESNTGWTSAGSIVASYLIEPTGSISIESLYFKPAAEIPGGGASVGNN